MMFSSAGCGHTPLGHVTIMMMMMSVLVGISCACSGPSATRAAITMPRHATPRLQLRPMIISPWVTLGAPRSEARLLGASPWECRQGWGRVGALQAGTINIISSSSSRKVGAARQRAWARVKKLLLCGAVAYLQCDDASVRKASCWQAGPQQGAEQTQRASHAHTRHVWPLGHLLLLLWQLGRPELRRRGGVEGLVLAAGRLDDRRLPRRGHV